MSNHHIESTINQITDDTFLDVISLLSFFLSNFCKCFLFIVSMFFFSFLIVIFSIIFDLEISFLNVSVEKATQKIFRAENVIEKNIVFVAIVLDFLQIFSLDKIAISNHNAKKSLKWTNFFCKRKFEWRRTTTLWCYFVVVVV